MGSSAVETRTLRADLFGETVGHRGARPGTRHRYASCKSKLLARNRCAFPAYNWSDEPRPSNGHGCVYLPRLS